MDNRYKAFLEKQLAAALLEEEAAAWKVTYWRTQLALQDQLDLEVNRVRLSTPPASD